MITLGVDVGSTASKAILLEDGITILSKEIVPLGAGTFGARKAVENALEAVECKLSQVD